MRSFFVRLGFVFSLVLLRLSAAPPSAAAATMGGGPRDEVRLVLQITVDQLRGDLLERYREKFGPDGFRRLIDRGVWYTNAHYQTANTITASGHAVLATGADTAQHGMVANEWWDRATGKIVYCTSDARYPVLDAAASPGQSPANLLSSTIGDEIVAASAGRGRAFAVAGKDRSSIIPGGHRGKAFWWAEKSGGFVSSTYYFEKLPEWVSTWNAGNPAGPFRKLDWTPLRPPESYAYAATAANPLARPEKTLGRSFPHPLLAQSDALFFAAFRFTPFLDVVTGAFAGELIEREKIGQGSAVDYLSISFSSNDYIGHAYGPNTMEAEDGLLRLDRTLATLLQGVERSVGLEHCLIVLSGDHGVDDVPEARRAQGNAAGRIQPPALVAKANEFLRERFGVAEDLVAAFVPPGFYLADARLAALKLDHATVERALAEQLRTARGIAQAITRTDLLAGQAMGSSLRASVQRAFHPKRSGDVVIVQDEFWYLYPEAETYAAMHGSPYAYDTFVPILVVLPGGTGKILGAPVSPAQIAPTLALLLRTNAPSGCTEFAPLPGLIH